MSTREIQIRTTGWLLAALCALGVALALAPAAHASGYSVKGSFLVEKGEGAPEGLAVDESDDHLYVADFGEGVFEYESLGTLVPPRLFAAVGFVPTGVAVDPVNRNVYAYDESTQEIKTFEPSPSRAEVRHFTVTGAPGTHIQIASDPAGDIFYPNQTEKTVQEFAPEAKEGEATPVLTIAPTGAHELVEPQGVAVDSAHGKVYVVDSGNGGATPGRVQVFNASSGSYESTLNEAGAHDVAVDPVTGDVFVLDLNSNNEAECKSLAPACYRVLVYHTGETTPFAEFGEGAIPNGTYPDRLAVDHHTGYVYVSVGYSTFSPENNKVLIFQPGTPPEVSYPVGASERVTGITASEATLHGEVNPQGNEGTSCHFEYGTSTSYEHTVPCEPPLVGEGSRAKPEPATIKGLEGNTEYHFRLIVTTAGGATIEGADETFTTSEAPPSLLASSVFASDVTQSDLVFKATINPQNLDTHYYFNYGLYPFEDSGTCVPSGTVPYASAPVTPLELLASSFSTSEELAGLPVSLDLAGVSVVLHPGMESRALQPNTAYHFQIVAENARGTNCEPEATFVTLPPDPVASTGAASQVTQSTANLAGAVTPGSTGPNSDTTWRFQYGIDTSYSGGSVPATPADAGMGTSAVAVSTALTGLAPNTTYHYRLVASNANHDPAANPAAVPQIANGADRTFTTPPAEPLAGQPSSMAETGATLNGEANPGEHPLEYRFEYGTSTAYGQSTPTESAGAGGGYTPVSAPLTGLTPGVTYHYRLVAIGAGGDSYSPDATFTLYAPAPPSSGNPFSPGQGAPAPFGTLPLLSTPTFPPPPTETTPPPAKPLTNAQKLSKALKTCKRLKQKAKRVACETSARKKYAPPHAAKHSSVSQNAK
jgi:DNA-binding beta-propeller fold protein YncE